MSAASEARLDGQKEIYGISDFARFIASCSSIERLKHRRKRNYDILMNALIAEGVYPAIAIKRSDTPLVYPLRVRDRDKLRNFLLNKQVYCAIHWPFDNHKSEQRAFAKKNADELLSLPIDQRYDESHIQYLIDTLKMLGGGLQF